MGSEFFVSSGGPSSSVSATEKEWSISPNVASVPAGTVTFSATNQGTRPHEFVVLRTDATPVTVAVKDGKATEDGAVGEAAAVRPGERKSVTHQPCTGN